MNRRPLSPLPYTIALGVAGTVYLGAPAAEPHLAASPAPERGTSCPVPFGKQIQAVKAFKEMLPVFRHPRCLNCHGGLDPHSEGHPGADQIEDLDRMANMEEFKTACQQCHDGLPGWNTPAPVLFFPGKSDEQLCKQMKQFEPTGESFVSHIHDDHGGIQFIAVGFAGDRALGEGLRDYGLTVEKPPGTQAELTEKARKWVELLGHGYEASPECGCVLPKVKLGIRHVIVSDIPNGLPSREESEAKFEVELEPVGEATPGLYQGEHNLTREIRLTVPQECKANASREESWTFRAVVDTVRGTVKVWRSLESGEPRGDIACRHGDGSARIGLTSAVGSGMLGFGELELQGDSGASKTLAEEDLDVRETLTITVLEVSK
jgi:hypothetical protein